MPHTENKSTFGLNAFSGDENGPIFHRKSTRTRTSYTAIILFLVMPSQCRSAQNLLNFFDFLGGHAHDLQFFHR